MSFCTNCGTKLEENTSFCTKCGKKVDEYDKKPKTLFGKIKKEIGYIDESVAPESYKFFDELLESDEIKSRIKKYNIGESEIKSIRNNLKNKLISNQRLMSNDEIQNYLNTELNNEIDKKDLKENRMKYLEDILKDSSPNIKLATFEKKHVNNIELYGNINQKKKELNNIAEGIITTHNKIGEYDFAGILIEEAGLTNRVDPIGLNKRVRKEPNYTSYVFLKICDENMKIVGSEIKTINLNTRLGIDMTIFFRDIISVNYATDWKNNGEIKFNLNNRNFKLIANKEDEKYLEEFYKLFNNKWIKFKNNETVNNISTHKNEVSPADELMKYAELHEKGLLSEDEFNAVKKKLLQL